MEEVRATSTTFFERAQDRFMSTETDHGRFNAISDMLSALQSEIYSLERRIEALETGDNQENASTDH